MRTLLAAGLLLALAASACTVDQQARLQGWLTVACAADGKYQPIALSVLQTVGAVFAPAGQAAALDAALIHPAVVAFCAQYGAKPAIVPASAPVTVSH